MAAATLQADSGPEHLLGKTKSSAASQGANLRATLVGSAGRTLPKAPDAWLVAADICSGPE